MNEQQRKALSAWLKSYSAKLDRIADGNKRGEDYGRSEQDLFEAFGCSTSLPRYVMTVFTRNASERDELKIACITYFPALHEFEDVSDTQFTCVCNDASAALALSFLKRFYGKKYLNGWVGR